MSDIVKAIDLNAAHLNRWVTVADYAGVTHHGLLHRIEFHGDPRVRVVLGIATQEPINPEDGGGWYWSFFASDKYVNRDAEVTVGEIARDEERVTR